MEPSKTGLAITSLYPPTFKCEKSSWSHGEKDGLTVSDYDRMLVMRRQTSICGMDGPTVTQQALVARADCDTHGFEK